ncbi:flagellar M-ring protein FliF [Methylovorus sp. MM2]|uniref:flagellar basal-body MS-ring/collar protein FliF n=1 Tax=Methylovorus sp. MM2 TaxID=1848038 RepID=UPI0007E1FB89|nr:flagellar basal-body MS-ring/collar protein FliF [Methylovorus sp. MM2]OAM51257.1 flagellar M-ring protein FliF [Methylovorus sp. MM2]
MAAVTEAAFNNGNLLEINRSLLSNKFVLGLGVAVVAAIMVVFWLWSQQPDYRVLFSNYADKDGGAIVAALEQMNVPYKFSDSGTAILVPATDVHQTRLKLAAQGLPKGGNIGFELLENQKFGVSQFVEQVNFQRALEGELERTIQAVSAVEVARIHLAIPKPSVFVRDQQRPTASVLLNLRQGRVLDPQQVSAIVHLVATSVPELSVSNVTVVDQNGNLLSDTSKKSGLNNLDPSQLKYVDELQQNIAKRVESIISPIIGAKNVHAEASAEVDFSTQEQAAEIYKPNQTPEEAAIRSMQSNESKTVGDQTNGGVPGALSNQPPVPNTAPLNTPAPATAANGATPAPGTAAAQAAAAAAAAAQTPKEPLNSQKNVTTNYEVDKTVRYTQQPMGGIKRLSVAVVVNNIQSMDAKGKVTSRALTDAEKTQISDLAKQAMGFNTERGDSLTVVNSSFVADQGELLPSIPFWKDPEYIGMAKEFLRIGVVLLILFMLYSRVMKPMLRKMTQPPVENLPAPGDNQDTVVNIGGDPLLEARKIQPKGYEQSLIAAKQIAKENPKLVANMVTNWVSGNE